jgi:hypothetical protein
MSALVIARGDPATAGISSELAGLAVIVVGFWLLIGLIFFALWFAKRRREATPQAQADAERDGREHLAWLDTLRVDEEEQRQPTLDLPGVVRVTGRHRKTG